MKKLLPLILIVAFIISNNFCIAQNSDENTIRGLEEKEREAILNSDTAALYKLMHPKLVVHNPENTIVKLEQIMARVKSGKINYTSFERSIENVSFVENIAIVMGKEVLVPKGASTNAGKTITRRFTNIWMKTKGTWKLTARQATIISAV
jgi:ketosteroid isomerase-like protein